jgi:hypothetical protein
MYAIFLCRFDTWQTHLTNEKPFSCPKDNETWTDFDIDVDLLSPKDRSDTCKYLAKKYQETIPLTQPAAGQQFGLTYVIQFDLEKMTCFQMNEGLAHFVSTQLMYYFMNFCKVVLFQLEINSIMDDSNMLRNGINIPHNHEVDITLEPVIIVSDRKIDYFKPVKSITKYCLLQIMIYVLGTSELRHYW